MVTSENTFFSTLCLQDESNKNLTDIDNSDEFYDFFNKLD